MGTITCTFGPNKHRSPMRMALQSRNTQLKFTYTSRPAEGSRWGVSVGRHTSSAAAEGGRKRTEVNIEALRSSAHATSAVALQMPCPGSARQHVACQRNDGVQVGKDASLQGTAAWGRVGARDAHVVALKGLLYTWRLVIREASHKPLQDAAPGAELLGG